MADVLDSLTDEKNRESDEMKAINMLFQKLYRKLQKENTLYHKSALPGSLEAFMITLQTIHEEYEAKKG